MKTGYYNYSTEEDGLCDFDTAEDAIACAKTASRRTGERVAVYNPRGDLYFTARSDLPTHAERCMSPEVHGWED